MPVPRLAAMLPLGAVALALSTAPAAAWHGQRGDGGHDRASHAQDHQRRGSGATAREAERQPGTVSVTGQGESSAAPDMAIITLGVTVQAPSAAEAMRQNTQRQQVVIETLRARGIESRDIQTSGLNLSPVQDFSREGRPPEITGYQATNMVTVRVRDLPRLGEALDALVGAGANEIHGVGFQRENIEAAEADARARAVENARLRAQIMADAAGMELGRLVAIADMAGRSGPQPMMRAMAMDSAAAAPVPIEAGELSVSAEVTVTWELRPARRGDGRRGQRQRGGMGEGMAHHMHGHHGMGDHHGMGGDRGMGDPRGMGGAGGMMPDAGGRAEPAFPHGHPGGGTRGEPGATGRAVPDSGPADAAPENAGPRTGAEVAPGASAPSQTPMPPAQATTTTPEAEAPVRPADADPAAEAAAGTAPSVGDPGPAPSSSPAPAGDVPGTAIPAPPLSN